MFSSSADQNRSGDYVSCRHRGFRLTVLRQAFSEDFLEMCCQVRTNGKIPFTVVPSSRYAVVNRFEYQGRHYFHKSFLYQSRIEPVKGFFRGTRAERSLRGYLVLRNGGLDAPRVVLVGKGARHSFAVSEAVRDGRTLRQCFQGVNGGTPYPEEIAHKKRVIGELGRTVGRMHVLGIFHGDLRLGNVMVDLADPERPRFIFLDNERTREAISENFDRLLNLAERKGLAVGIGHPYPETAGYLRSALPALRCRGIALAHVSEVLAEAESSAPELPAANDYSPWSEPDFYAPLSHVGLGFGHGVFPEVEDTGGEHRVSAADENAFHQVVEVTDSP